MEYKELIPLITAVGGALWGVYKGIVLLIARRKKQLINAKNQGKAEAQDEQIDELRYKELLDKIGYLQIEIEHVSDDYQDEYRAMEQKLLDVAGRIIDGKLIQEFIERNSKYYAEIEVLKAEIRNLKDFVYNRKSSND
jgi:hypothetical protein